MLPVTKYEVENRLTDIYERRQNMYTQWIILYYYYIIIIGLY